MNPMYSTPHIRAINLTRVTLVSKFLVENQSQRSQLDQKVFLVSLALQKKLCSSCNTLQISMEYSSYLCYVHHVHATLILLVHYSYDLVHARTCTYYDLAQASYSFQYELAKVCSSFIKNQFDIISMLVTKIICLTYVTTQLGI